MRCTPWRCSISSVPMMLPGLARGAGQLTAAWRLANIFEPHALQALGRRMQRGCAATTATHTPIRRSALSLRPAPSAVRASCRASTASYSWSCPRPCPLVLFHLRMEQGAEGLVVGPLRLTLPSQGASVPRRACHGWWGCRCLTAEQRGSGCSWLRPGTTGTKLQAAWCNSGLADLVAAVAGLFPSNIFSKTLMLRPQLAHACEIIHDVLGPFLDTFIPCCILLQA